MLIRPALLLRAEALAASVLVIMLYPRAGGSWWLFALLILAPDLSLAGYVAGAQVGARMYNLAHTYVLPLVLGAYGLTAGSLLIQQLALIWLAHISIDRAIGYGLKYPGAFQDTHFGRL